MAAEEESEALMVCGLEEPALTLSNTIEKPGTKTLNQKVESATGRIQEKQRWRRNRQPMMHA
jgi:hypothetical protein